MKLTTAGKTPSQTMDRPNSGTMLNRLIEAFAGLRTQWSALENELHADPLAVLDALSSDNASWITAVPGPVLQVLVTTALSRAIVSGKVDDFERIDKVSHAHKSRLSADVIAAVLSAVPKECRSGLYSKVLDAQAQRYPRHTGLLRASVEHALTCDALAAEHGLSMLGRLDPSFATRSYIRAARKVLPRASVTAKVALLGSFTLDSIVPHLDFEVHELGLSAAIHLAPFNAWPQELLTESSGTYQFDPDIIFLAVSIDDLIPELAGVLTPDALRSYGDTAVERVTSIARAHASISDRPLVVHSFYSVYSDPLGIAAGVDFTSGRSAWLARLNLRLAGELSKLPRSYLLDMGALLTFRANGALDNPKMRHLAAMRMTETICAELAAHYARYISAVKGLTRKCVVLDLDNTLWGGVIGEDGLHGIKLGRSAPGAEFREFQLYLKALTARGILLAINSKNNLEDALAVFRQHDAMVLREEDFSALRINWLPKHENMISIAKELNLDVGSFIFLDDNPKERALMRQLLPQVLTPELPMDPSLYRRTIESIPQLHVVSLTEEDRIRAQQYRANRQRDTAKCSSASLDSFLHSLSLITDIRAADIGMVSRIHQLFQRTNQFNLTTRRYDEGQVASFIGRPEFRLYAMRLSDRFGDHGLVGAVLARVDAEQWLIDSFLMSCRVIGYGAETSLLAYVVAQARAAHVKFVLGEYIRTAKNTPAADFYARHGFSLISKDSPIERWSLPPNVTVSSPAWIKVQRHDA